MRSHALCELSEMMAWSSEKLYSFALLSGALAYFSNLRECAEMRVDYRRFRPGDDGRGYPMIIEEFLLAGSLGSRVDVSSLSMDWCVPVCVSPQRCMCVFG